MDHDLVVIGGGAAALGAVRAATWQGRRAIMVVDGPIGGDCTFTGCVPSKTLIARAAQGCAFDAALAAVVDVVQRIAATEDAATLRREGVEVVEGRGRLVSATEIDVDGRRIVADRIVLATGARPAIPPVPGLDAVPFRTNETVFEPRPAPASMVVLGAGPVGCELAQAMARLGIAVTLLELADRVLPAVDPEASAVVEAALRSDGVDVRTSARVARIEGDGGPVTVHLDDGQDTPIVADEVLVAAGRRPNTEDLGLAEAGVGTDERGFVTVDARLRTSAASVYAAGDVTGLVFLSHAADEMGRLAAAHALRAGPRWRFRPHLVPATVFTDPEVATVGIGEAAAAARRGRVATASLTEVDRALAEGRTEGFVKLVAGPRRITRRALGGRLLGATIVAPRAGEMIHEVALAMRAGLFTGQLAQLNHAYPTWSSGVQKAVARFFVPLEGRSARPARDV